MKLLYLSMLSFFVVTTYTLITIPVKSQSTQIEYFKRSKVTNSLLPVLGASTSFPLMSAQGVIAVDLGSAVVMYEKNADLPLLPASTTKILTALTAKDYFKLVDVITVGNIKSEGQRMRLVWGEKITFENLLYGLLVFSANDAAEALAAAYPGGRDAFIQAMNQKAQGLNMKNSNFLNPSGLDQIGHVSTAQDMIHLSEVAMRDPVMAKIVATKELTVKSTDERFVHPLKNINQLLGVVEGVKGVKTGYTEGARENLVSFVERGDKRVLIALLGSQDRFGETKELIEWIFKNYSWTYLTSAP